MHRRHFLLLLIVVLLGGSALAGYWLVPLARSPDSLGQPLTAELLFHRNGETDTIHLDRLTGAARLEGMLPELHQQPSAAQAPAEAAMYRVTFTYPGGEERQVFVSEQTDSGEWFYGGGRFPVEGDLDLFLATLPVAKAVGAMWWSENLEQRRKGRKQLEEFGPQEIDLLLRCWKSGDEGLQREAARWLLLLISPRARIPPRCTDALANFDRTHSRPVDHPRAEEIRQAAMEALRRETREHHGTLYNTSHTEVERYHGYAFVTELCGLLAEIGTDRTAEELLAILQVISVRAPLAEALIDALEKLYGLPPLQEPVGICGTGLTEAESRRLARQAWQRRARARERLRQWREQYSANSPEDRLRPVVEQWQAFLNRPDSRLNSWGALSAAGIDRLLRFDPEVVPLVRDAQAEETGSLERGRLELPIAYLSREADAEIVNALLQGDEQQKLLACDIVAVADDERFITPLERVQQAEIGTVYQRIHETLEQLRHGVTGCDF